MAAKAKSEAVALVPIDDPQDARILQLRIDGKTTRQVAEELSIPEHEVRSSMRRVMPKIDAGFKRDQLALLVLRIERLTAAVQPKALKGDPEAQSAMIRISQEERALLGFYGSGYDPVCVAPTGGPNENSMSGFYRGLAKLGRALPVLQQSTVPDPEPATAE
jgi:DNA-binding CsgD family transcriptional regulator